MARIHPTTVIDPQANIAPDVTIGPYCVIDGDVRIEAGCRLYHNVYVTGWTTVGERCVIHPGAIVGHEPQDTKFTGQRSYCNIGAGTIIREYATIHRGSVPDSSTIVGENCFLLGGCHVAHNCRLGDRVTMINNVLLAGHVEIDDDATLGGSAAVHQFVRVGKRVMIHGHCRVQKDIIPYAMVDDEGRIAGVNQVGLRRHGTPREHVDDLRAAIRILFSTKGTLQERIERLESELPTPLVAEVVAFARAKSERGLAGRVRGAKDRLTGGLKR